MMQCDLQTQNVRVRCECVVVRQPATIMRHRFNNFGIEFDELSRVERVSVRM